MTGHTPMISFRFSPALAGFWTASAGLFAVAGFVALLAAGLTPGI